MRSIVTLILIVVPVVGGAAWYAYASRSSGAEFRTEPVTRGDVVVGIDSTGTIEAEETIDVGARWPD